MVNYCQPMALSAAAFGIFVPLGDPATYPVAADVCQAHSDRQQQPDALLNTHFKSPKILSNGRFSTPFCPTVAAIPLLAKTIAIDLDYAYTGVAKRTDHLDNAGKGPACTNAF